MNLISKINHQFNSSIDSIQQRLAIAVDIGLLGLNQVSFESTPL